MDHYDVKLEFSLTTPPDLDSSNSSSTGFDSSSSPSSQYPGSSASDNTIASTSSSSNSTANAGSVPEFIQKLFRMLENEAFQSTFCWGPDGTTFVVKDTNEFSKTVLPKHFKHCNFASFVRQLNKYDFHKVRATDSDHHRKTHPSGDQWEFVHPKFRRDRKDILDGIRRKPPGKTKKDDSLQQTTSLTTSNDKPTTTTSSPDSEPTKRHGTGGRVAEIRQMTEGLQKQIHQLLQSHAEMKRTLDHFNQRNTLILNEFSNLTHALAAKDKLIHEFIQQHTMLPGEQHQHGHSTSASSHKLLAPMGTQNILESYQKVAQINAQQLGTIARHLQDHHRQLEGATDTSQHDISPDVAAAAALNAGSLIGSSLRTPNGLAFVTLGCLPPNLNHGTSAPESASATTVPQDNNDNSPNAVVPSRSLLPPQHQALPLPLPPPPIISMENSSLNLRRKSANGWTVPPRVLLVDDDSVYRDISGRLLNMIGCTIDLAKDGVEAIKKMGIEKYDLILMDIMMPNLDGISATRSIRQRDILTPIISMTSNFTDQDIMQYVGSGMNDILPKPFSKRTLYDMLEKYCAHLKVIQRIHDPTAAMMIPREVSMVYQGSSSSSSSSSSGSTPRVEEQDLIATTSSAAPSQQQQQLVIASGPETPATGYCEPSLPLSSSVMFVGSYPPTPIWSTTTATTPAPMSDIMSVPLPSSSSSSPPPSSTWPSETQASHLPQSNPKRRRLDYQ